MNLKRFLYTFKNRIPVYFLKTPDVHRSILINRFNVLLLSIIHYYFSGKPACKSLFF